MLETDNLIPNIFAIHDDGVMPLDCDLAQLAIALGLNQVFKNFHVHIVTTRN